MARLSGFLAETAEGTTLYNAATSTVTPFGYMTRGFPIPFPTRKETLTFQSGVRGQQSVTLGAKVVEATYDFDYGHAYPWALALGAVSTTTGVSTISLSDPDDLPAFSIYSESNGKAYITNGCKVEQLTMKLVEGKPAMCEMDIMGWDTTAATVINGGAADVTWPSGAEENVKGPSLLPAGAFTIDGDSQPDLRELMIVATNSLDAAPAILSPVTTGINVLETGGFMATFKGNFRGTADDLFEKFVAAADGDDLVVKWAFGTGLYHQITLKGMTLGKPVVLAGDGRSTEYALSAWATGDCIEVEVKDGHDYESLI